MRHSAKIEQTAIAAVARHFDATLEAGKDRAGAFVRIAGKRIAVTVTPLAWPAARGAAVAKPQLRFDRVALRVVDRLRSALDGSVPDGSTVVATITAPIRLPSRTAAALAERIRRLVASRAAPARLTDTIHGNGIQVHLIKGGTSRTTRLIGFVHNPAPDPAVLIHVSRALLAGIGSRERGTGSRWLIVADRNGLVPIETYRQVCSQLSLQKIFEQIVVVFPGEKVTTLSGASQK